MSTFSGTSEAIVVGGGAAGRTGPAINVGPNPSAGPTCTPFDLFNRAVGGQWGTANDGHVWTITHNDGSIDVPGGYGSIALPATSSGNLLGALKTNNGGPWGQYSLWQFYGLIEFDGTLDSLAAFGVQNTTDAFSYGWQVRPSNGDLFDSDSGQTAAFSYALGVAYAVRAQIDYGAGLAKAKIWPAGYSEPDWMLSGPLLSFDADPASYFFVSATNVSTGSPAALTVKFSQFESCAGGLYDLFGRSLAIGAGWGNADSGQPWITTGPPVGFGVDGTQGVMTSAASTDIYVALPSQTYVDQMFVIPAGWVFGSPTLNVYFDGVAFNGLSGAAIQFSSGFLHLNLNRDGQTPATYNYVVTTGTSVNVRVRCDQAAMYIKIWAIGANEPTTWTQQTSGGSPTPISTFYFDLYAGGAFTIQRLQPGG